MDQITNNWFTEKSDMWPGQAFSLEVDKVLHSEKSKYQDILLLQTKMFGRALILDGIIQCTEKDEFAYQEMASFLPLCCHKNPEKVLIVGGGDGGVAREVAKHPKVKEIYLVEIDDRVIELCKEYLPFMAKGFDNKKLTLKTEDGFKFMKEHQNEFDVIITDSSDPIGPAQCLFEENYYTLMKSALRGNGIVCSQAGTVWNNMVHVKQTLQYAKTQFATAAYAVTSVQSYPSGQIGFVIGSLDANIDLTKPDLTFSDDEISQMNLRYYNSDIHTASFVLPTYVKNAFNS